MRWTVIGALALVGSLALAAPSTSSRQAVRNGKIAFSVLSSASRGDLCLISPNGTKRMRLTRGRKWDGLAAWSPDGRRLAFTRNAGPKTVGNAEGRNSRILVMGPNRASRDVSLPTDFPGDGYPRWSPDGSLIAFSDLPWKYAAPSVWVMRPDGSERRLVVADGAVASWSPDGRSLVYMAFVGPVAMAAGLAVVDLDGNGKRRLVADGASPAWSPDGETIAFDRPTGIFTIRPDGSGERLLISRAQSPAWSPDGARLVFVRNGDLYTANADGTGIRRLTKTKAREYAPAWQPVTAAGTARAWERPGPSC